MRLQILQEPSGDQFLLSQNAQRKYALFSGNLVVDIPLSPLVLTRIGRSLGQQDEFTHVRYTAVTCGPQSLSEEEFSPRAGLFYPSRKTDILLSVFHTRGDPSAV